VRVKDLAALLQAPFEGDGECELRKAAALEDAGPEDLAFVTRGRAAKIAESSTAGCLLVPLDFENAGAHTVIRTANPRVAMARAIRKLHPRVEPSAGVHPSAVLGPGTTIGHGVHVGPLVSIGAGVHVGAGSSIGPGSVIGDYVVIGEKCSIHANVTIYNEVTLGKEVVLHSGCVIGADGFGYVLIDGAYENFPQIGRVEIGDRVEIGANSCVDRAALGVTSIGDGTKLDNMVHVGHNCRIGRNVVVAAQTGFSGGVVVEDYAVIGGQVGVGDKARIESRAVLGSGSGVLTSKVVRAGQVMWGTPARPLKEHLEQLAVLSRMTKKRKPAAEK
jgi:UDP-3-O-[3-hydroxymyristoyl] glucosamine N-acyltransferase